MANYDAIPPEKALEYCRNELRNDTMRIQNSITFLKDIIETVPENRHAIDNALSILEGHVKSLHVLLEAMNSYIDEYGSE